VFWKPVYYLLEDDVECWLLNAQHLKNVPGRKTDVADAAWIAQLVEHGLVRPSFVPPRPIRELRELTRYRKALIYERTREIQRLHKVLEDAGIKLGCVASDVLGVSGRAMLEALVGGTTDPEVLAELARGSCARSSRRCGRRSRAESHATIGCWSPSCWRTWTTWRRPSGGCQVRSPG
jgi:transposase